MTAEVDKYKIILVSGFDNNTDLVRNAHDAAESAWNKLGIETIRIDPDYPNGSLDEAVAKIKAETQDAVDNGYKVTKVGTSAGGTLLTAERILSNDLTSKAVTICSRTDLESPPSGIPGIVYPTRDELSVKSPMLVAAAGYVHANMNAYRFTDTNTLCITGMGNDELVPPKSSILPGAQVFHLESVKGHRKIIGAVLYLSQHTGRIGTFAKAA